MEQDTFPLGYNNGWRHRLSLKRLSLNYLTYPPKRSKSSLSDHCILLSWRHGKIVNEKFTNRSARFEKKQAENRSFLQINSERIFHILWAFFNKTISIPPAPVGYELIIANSALRALLAVYRLISNAHSWNNCELKINRPIHIYLWEFKINWYGLVLPMR